LKGGEILVLLEQKILKLFATIALDDVSLRGRGKKESKEKTTTEGRRTLVKKKDKPRIKRGEQYGLYNHWGQSPSGAIVKQKGSGGKKRKKEGEHRG